MKEDKSKVILITGASSGMGKSAAQILLGMGHRVYGLARRQDEMKDLKDKGAIVMPLDLTRDASIQNCIQTILEKENRIDVLINNAGYGSYGAVEEVTLDEARRQFEVNLFGLARITQLVLPLMRSKNSGRIVNVSSMGGRIYTPFGAWYHATKHAMEGWSDCLRLEVKEFGIKVVVVQPGIIRTSWVDVSIDYLIQSSGSGAYHQSVHRFAHLLQKLYSHSRSTSPEILGRWIAKAATTDRPRTRYAKGLLAIPAITLRTWFGDRLYDTAFMWVMKKSN